MSNNTTITIIWVTMAIFLTTFGSNWDSFGEEGDTFYYSPIEGYEAAINYCLNELI
jgi:hypothetical protein